MKKYELPEENLEGAMVQEPAAYPRTYSQDAAVLTRGNYGVAEDEEDEEEVDEATLEQITALFAHTPEEVLEICMEAEKHKDDPSYWISEEEFNRRLYTKYPWLR